MTVGDVNLVEAGKITISDGFLSMTLRYDAKKWAATTELPSTEGMEYSSFKTKWDSKPVRRIILTNTAPEAKGKFVYSFKRD